MDIRTTLAPGPGVNRLDGFYRAVVIDNRDPDIDQAGITYGRVRVNIPMLMKTPEAGIWAYPANNPLGGRNRENLSENIDKNGGKMEYCGSFYVPPTGSFVIIFFEGGDPNRPFYMGGLDIKAHEAPPEINIGTDKKPEERWLIFRSPQGRTIVVSDDEDNCRIEITGKKRKAAGDTSAHVYDISGNQKTILIDDRDGKEKILIEDQKGNYVNIRTASNSIDVHANGTLRLNAGGNIFIKAGGNVNIEGSKINTQSGSFNANAGSFLAAAGDVSLTGECRLGPTVHLCEGTTAPGGVDGDSGPSGDRGASSGKSGNMTYYVSTGGGAAETNESVNSKNSADTNPPEQGDNDEKTKQDDTIEKASAIDASKKYGDVYIGSARFGGENKKPTGGQRGKQADWEVSREKWYKHRKGWIVLRPQSAYAEKIASAMDMACDSSRIGYNQADRYSLYNAVKSIGFDISRLTEDVNTDCSALVRVCMAYAGISTNDFNTSSQVSVMMGTGKFEKLTDKKYTDSPKYLKRGDVLVTAKKGHTVVVLNDGGGDEEENEESEG